jgi:hypothetical protein
VEALQSHPQTFKHSFHVVDIGIVILQIQKQLQCPRIFFLSQTHRPGSIHAGARDQSVVRQIPSAPVSRDPLRCGRQFQNGGLRRGPSKASILVPNMASHLFEPGGVRSVRPQDNGETGAGFFLVATMKVILAVLSSISSFFVITHKLQFQVDLDRALLLLRILE